jgi:hypothetical protein
VKNIFFIEILLIVSIYFVLPVAAAPVSQPTHDVESSDTIGWSLHLRNMLDYDPAKKSIFPEFYNRFRDWREKTKQNLGLETIFSYYTLFQGYTDGDLSVGASSGDADFSGRWLMHESKYHRPTYLSFRMRYRHAYDDFAPSELAANSDLLWKTVDGFTDAGFQIPSLYVSQELFHSDLTLRYGQFSIDNFFDSNKMRSAKHILVNNAFSNNPTVAFPSYGAGFTMLWNEEDRWDFAVGLSNIQGTDYTTEYVSFGLTSTALFVIAQGGYNFDGFGMLDARIQLMGWQNYSSDEPDLNEGNGLSITFEHAGRSAGERFMVRYAFSGDDVTAIDQMLTAGWGQDVRSHDHFGLGVGIGRSVEDSDLWQGVGEIYYRWQVTKELTISPDLQLIVGKGPLDEEDFHVVAGLRAGFTF